MKRCPKKQLVAMHALGHATATEAEAVAQHLRECQDCREYSLEIQQIGKALAPAGAFAETPLSTLTFSQLAGPRKHRGRIPAVFGWPVGIAAALVLFAGVFLSLPERDSKVVQTAPSETRVEPSSPLSMSSYRAAAEESLDDLEALLSEQGLRSFTPQLADVRSSEL